MSIDLGSDLLNYIVRCDYHAGDRLPSISELKADDKLGVSTSKIREQLEAARVLGLVDVRSKTGTHLRPYSFTPPVRLSLLYALARDPHVFQHFSELRTHVEFAFWHEACELLQPDDLTVMRRCVDAADAKLSGDWIRIPHDEHRLFHLTVFRRLDNPFVLGLLEAYWDAYEAIHLNTYADFRYLRDVWDYHARILAAIEGADFEGARELFMQHTRLLRFQPALDERDEDLTASPGRPSQPAGPGRKETVDRGDKQRP